MLFMPAQANNIHMESMEVPSPEVNGDVFNKLMEKVFELGAQQNKTITSNGFSQDGARHVGKVIDRMVAEHGSPSFASIHQV